MSLNTSDEVAIEERRAKAWELRVRGKSYRAIATELGVSQGTIFSDVKALLERTRAETNDTVDHHRTLQLQRIDRALDALWPKIENGETEAMRVLVRLEKRRAELMGLDAPEKHSLDLQAIVAASPAAAARLVREQFGAQGAATEPALAPESEPA